VRLRLRFGPDLGEDRGHASLQAGTAKTAALPARINFNIFISP
jgi:hypothetical protein